MGLLHGDAGSGYAPVRQGRSPDSGREELVPIPKEPELRRTAYRGRHGAGLETPRAGRRETADLRPLPPGSLGAVRRRGAAGPSGPGVPRGPSSGQPECAKLGAEKNPLARRISHVWTPVVANPAGLLRAKGTAG